MVKDTIVSGGLSGLYLFYFLRAEMYCKCCTRMILFIEDDMRTNKTISMSIRVSEEELEKLKLAVRIESYASYSEFIRRTAHKEATRVLNEHNEKDWR